MLRHYKSVETTDENGQTWLMVTSELEDDPCVVCGGESVMNECPGDGRYHHHGKVHTVAGGLAALCGECIIAIDAEWYAKRQGQLAYWESRGR